MFQVLDMGLRFGSVDERPNKTSDIQTSTTFFNNNMQVIKKVDENVFQTIKTKGYLSYSAVLFIIECCLWCPF